MAVVKNKPTPIRVEEVSDCKAVDLTLEAFKNVLSALDGLSNEQKLRVIKSVAVFYEIELPRERDY